ncbi:MAG: helix-turn-helix domain-containing protein [Nanoarchaeota archaeon]
MAETELTGEEIEILTICYQKPGNVEEIAQEVGREPSHIQDVLNALAEKSMVVEKDGVWKTTSDGDGYMAD